MIRAGPCWSAALWAGRALQRFCHDSEQMCFGVRRWPPPTNLFHARGRWLTPRAAIEGKTLSRIPRPRPRRPTCRAPPRADSRAAPGAEECGCRTRSDDVRDRRGADLVSQRSADSGWWLRSRARWRAPPACHPVAGTRVPGARAAILRARAWAADVISVTSSRNNTPPDASSICPGLACCAPVKAPRSNPNGCGDREMARVAHGSGRAAAASDASTV
jgi:hypothetical protein